MDISLGGIDATLTRPGHMATLALSDMLQERTDFHGRTAIAAAAMRICWPADRKWPGTRRPLDWSIRTHLLDYGAECYETLSELPDEQVLPVLFEALRFALESRLTEEAVREAEGFTGATEGD